jgi:hypothetical protein
MIKHQWHQSHSHGEQASMGMVDIRILGNIQMPERQLLPHHNNLFISNILYITKHRQYPLRNHNEQAKVKGRSHINR